MISPGQWDQQEILQEFFLGKPGICCSGSLGPQLLRNLLPCIEPCAVSLPAIHPTQSTANSEICLADWKAPEIYLFFLNGLSGLNQKQSAKLGGVKFLRVGQCPIILNPKVVRIRCFQSESDVSVWPGSPENMLETIWNEKHFTGQIIITRKWWISRSLCKGTSWTKPEVNQFLQKSPKLRGHLSWNLSKMKERKKEKQKRRNENKWKIGPVKFFVYFFNKATGLQAKARKIVSLFLWKNYEIQIERVFWSVWGWHFNGAGFSKAAYYSPIQ